ncbi:hypothetical protein PHMEG_0006133 [Phytophthora megakarya]|uniref:FCH domain-containing protein n=1 Tax=Phytophthora megakarya TaxID=4795 RepID=A0A225WPM0_9STRA|nr:hypothetical protein PHMEG_0006133 [Phytophthora megakarya]
MLKSRINLERTYAQELSKLANYSQLDEMEHGTMKTAMASLRAQYLNTSVQHQQLAKSLEEDVLRPIEILYEYNSERAQSLTRRINSAKKDVKAQEDAYRKEYSVFDKNFRDASTAFSAAMASGFSSTVLEDQYHQRLSQMQIPDSPPKPHTSTATTTRYDKSPGTALKTINNRKLVSWLLPTSEAHRKEDLANNTVKLMEAAEKSRRKCQQAWHGVETNRIRMYRVVQAVLADYQQLAENRIFTITTNLRKHVVFASSTLANEQYDWQVVAPNFENVNVKSDIYDFIHATRGNKDRVLLTVNDLCTDTTRSLISSPSKPCRPLRKTCLEIRDISSKKIPFDYDGNQKLLREALTSRHRVSSGIQYHQRQEAQESSCRDGHTDLQIDCTTPCSEHDFGDIVGDTDTNSTAEQATDGEIDVEVEDKRSIAKPNEPEYDGDENSPNASPSASSNSSVMDFSSCDHEDGIVHDTTPVSSEA